MDNSSDLSIDRIPLIEVSCPNCGAKLLVPMCIDIGTILCPCCCPPLTPVPCIE